MLDSNQTRDMKLLRLMGQERRFQVLLLLCKRQMSHEEICLALGKPMGVYKHLKGMVEAGLLIRTDITSRDVVYRANPKVLEDLGLCLQDMAIDAHEISYRIAQGIPDEEMDEKPAHAERQFEKLADMGKVYGRKPEDIMPDVDDATRREMMAILGDEIKPAELSQEEIDNAAALYEETKLDDE